MLEVLQHLLEIGAVSLDQREPALRHLQIGHSGRGDRVERADVSAIHVLFRVARAQLPQRRIFRQRFHVLRAPAGLFLPLLPEIRRAAAAPAEEASLEPRGQRFLAHGEEPELARGRMPDDQDVSGGFPHDQAPQPFDRHAVRVDRVPHLHLVRRKIPVEQILR